MLSPKHKLCSISARIYCGFILDYLKHTTLDICMCFQLSVASLTWCMSDSLSVSDSVTAQLMLSSVSAGQPRLVLARLLRRDSGGWRLLEAARPGHAELWSVSEQGHLDRGRGSGAAAYCALCTVHPPVVSGAEAR